MNLEESNNYLIKLFETNKPFIISRLGIGSETFITTEYISNKNINTLYIASLDNNAGIYDSQKNLHVIKIYCEEYNKCIKNSKALACFDNSSIENHQNFFIKIYNLDKVSYKVLEPFYCCLENIKPWTNYLLGKKILIINPFVDSMKKQLDNKFQIFKDKPIFLEGQEFVFYKSYQTSAGNHIHKNWIETFTKMCFDIKNLEFDIALLGCGGYGLPLSNFIYEKMGKQAIYVGGGLQLLFGIMGKRWESIPMWQKIMSENPNFIRPSNEEIMKNNNRIEGGCYW